MARMVEICDVGVEKKKPWFSFLLPKKSRQFEGEHNIACFKTIQETVDRNMTTGTMDAAMRLGFFSVGDMMSIKNSDGPQQGSGLDAFQTNILSKLNVIV